MTDTLEYILNKINVTVLPNKSPIEIIGVDRWDWLSVLFRELGFTLGAEIGVEEGKYSEQLCKNIPGLTLHCIDAWTAYKGYREHVSQAKLDDIYAIAQKRLFHFNALLKKQFSMDAVKEYADESLDFVFIDGNHDFRNVSDDICEWSKKVRVGGIVSGHDYRRMREPYTCHVKDVVQAYAYSHGIHPWFVLKDKNHVPSWMWVKK